MNICVFMGRLTAEPELRMTPNGVAVTTFALAVERKRTKGNAATDFFDVVAWRLLTFSMWSLGGNAANLPANTSTKDSGWWYRAKC